jgi:hypothetical protein
MEMGVNIMVFLGIGVLLFSMITAFVHDWDFIEDVSTLEEMYQDKNKISDDMKVDKIKFVTAARNFWDYCNHSFANKSKIYYVYENDKETKGNLTKEILFDHIKTLGWCQSIQSENLSCGRREDVNMTDIILPKVIKLNCRNSTLYIR